MPASPDYNRGWNIGFKAAIIVVLGDKCSKCGITDRRLLEIDHKYGGGTKHRQATGHGVSYYLSIARGALTGKYRLLCANCHTLNRRRK
jgi:hypothetical protein